MESPSTSKILSIRRARSSQDFDTIRLLFREYQTELGVDLGFQGFEEEIATLPGRYSPPDGELLLAYRDGALAGCVGIRKLSEEICELKRLFLRPAARGLGAGRELTETAMAVARQAGYRHLRLDTLPQMEAAIRMYHSLGFREIGAYTNNPVPGAQFLEIELNDRLRFAGQSVL